ncbi:MAG TPA: acetyl-CoA carboxylase carboxyltransferase subunit alpha [Bacillota bacterium]|nr:acetyl-CoA carboxylase carboxyltransferase subunit alpha [Bacillota bacterium]HOL10384.1 acetyl-CoA carboxylase carboxyltransferase subunit alpha [Bacillota bacterium]HPO97437.1 acetyl-CoA carboxylase carboxyltransferase subunit alpha [Bacillota bacterium]
MGPVLEFEKPVVDLERQIEELKEFSKQKGIDMAEQIAALESKAESLRLEIYKNLTTWQRIQIVRHPKRPTCLDYIAMIFDNFIELHGDRCYRDDPAMVGGIAYLDKIPVTVIGQQKGRDTKENIYRNFGLPHPEGYRKALRLMKQANKFNRPVICIVDVVGAYPGIEAEERGQGEAIARNIMEMANLTVPVLVVITGEGGSGGALAVGVGNKIMILENAYYSVISPEGCASILWKDATKAPEAAETLKISSSHLLSMGIVDEIIPEPLGGAHKNPSETANNIKNALINNLNSLLEYSPSELLEMRYKRFRDYGKFIE